MTFTASAIGFASPPAFSWCRAPPNSNLCVLIEGAVDQHYDIASVQLSDDGAQFMVTANGNEGTAHSAFATLHVSSMAAVVYLDGDFLEPGWLAIASAASADAHRFQVLRAAEGGHPGAHRLIHYEITAAARPLRTFHAAIGANYYPTSQGEIYRIDFEEECMARAGEATPVAVPFIEQNSRRFIAAKAAGRCEIDNWVSSARGSLGAEDFSIAEGPACGDGESCPDFSATAAPLRFGFGSIVDNASPPIDNARYVQRVDNWKVTVWRR